MLQLCSVMAAWKFLPAQKHTFHILVVMIMDMVQRMFGLRQKMSTQKLSLLRHIESVSAEPESNKIEKQKSRTQKCKSFWVLFKLTERDFMKVLKNVLITVICCITAMTISSVAVQGVQQMCDN